MLQERLERATAELAAEKAKSAPAQPMLGQPSMDLSRDVSDTDVNANDSAATPAATRVDMTPPLIAKKGIAEGELHL